MRLYRAQIKKLQNSIEGFDKIKISQFVTQKSFISQNQKMGKSPNEAEEERTQMILNSLNTRETERLERYLFGFAKCV